MHSRETIRVEVIGKRSRIKTIRINLFRGFKKIIEEFMYVKFKTVINQP